MTWIWRECGDFRRVFGPSICCRCVFFNVFFPFSFSHFRNKFRIFPVNVLKKRNKEKTIWNLLEKPKLLILMLISLNCTAFLSVTVISNYLYMWNHSEMLLSTTTKRDKLRFSLQYAFQLKVKWVRAPNTPNYIRFSVEMPILGNVDTKEKPMNIQPTEAQNQLNILRCCIVAF